MSYPELKIVADFPAKTVVSSDAFVIPLDQDKGGCHTSSMNITIKSFPGDKHEWVRNFTVGHDPEGGYWAFSNGAMITSTPCSKTVTAGYELNSEITIAGKKFIIRPDHNKNIKFEEV